jgi:glycosyltransferase involved in cell wall biosynthesis
MTSKRLISIVIPCYNEEKNIETFPSKLFDELAKMPYTFEVLAVDDGSSKDNTWGSLVRLSEKYEFFHAFRHARNYGMGAAYQTCFDNAKGEFVITYSSDHEIPASNIAKVIEHLEQGFDVVNTHRKGRWSNDSFLRRLPSKIANYFIRSISGVDVQDTGSGLKGFRKFVVDNLKIYGDMHRFLPAYASLYTKRITEFEVEYVDREYGSSAYGSIKRTFSVFLDLFSMKFMLSFATKPFSMMPGRIFGTAGIASFVLGTSIMVYLVVVKFLFDQSIGDRPLLMGAVLLVLFGVQLVMTGLLGELMMRTYFEGARRSPYVVSEEVL